MSQKNSHVDPKERCKQDLDQRLTAYYGPQLPAQPLSEAAWFQLRDQLKPTANRRLRYQRPRFPRVLRTRSVQPAPAILQEAFAGLLVQTRYHRPSPDLRCAFRRSPYTPRVSISPLGRGQIRLLLPERNWSTLQPAALDVLLAAGLARYLGISRAFFLTQRALLVSTLLLALAILPVATLERRFLWDFLAALVCCLCGVSLFSWQQRAHVFRADRQAVRWLGRERVCQGLHGLADLEPARSRRLVQIEPTLAERITRVCGVAINSKDDCLTLVH